MHVRRINSSATEVTLTITAGQPDIDTIKISVLKKLSKNLSIPGFRKGSVPPSLVEKNIDQQHLQTEFLDEALSRLYEKAAGAEKIRPVTKPSVQITKFVPFTDLEFEVTTGIIGDIKLPDYKKITAKKSKVTVATQDVDQVIESLQTRMGDYKEVKRPAKKGDQVTIDFFGTDTLGKPVKGAEGKAYPLILGSNSFIPGFEDNLVGLKSGDKKDFTLKFPKNYGVSALANKNVNFSVEVISVSSITKPKLDGNFAKKVGPFKTVEDLRADIKHQLQTEKEAEALRAQQNEIVDTIAERSVVALPKELVDHQIEHNQEEIKRNLSYKGQTYEDFLSGENMSDDDYKKGILAPQAEKQLKTSLVLSEIAEKEGLSVSAEEIEMHIQLLKGQYAQDKVMQAELDKPENRQNIAQRLLTEKVLNLLVE